MSVKQILINNIDYSKENKRQRKLKMTLQRSWQHRAHKTKINKTKTQHNMCWTPIYANKNKLRK